MGSLGKGFIEECQRLSIGTFLRRDAGQPVKCPVLKAAVPCRFVKGVKGFLRFALCLEGKPQIKVRLTIVRIGMLPCGGADGLTERSFALLESAFVVQIFSVAVI